MQTFLFLALLLPSFALGIQVPYLTGPVVDTAHLLNTQEAQTIDSNLQAFHKRTGVQLVVLVTDSLEGEDIASYSIQVAEKWKLGRKKEDRGLLFVIAPKDRKMRLEVGYGLEGEIPDLIAKRILSQIVGPHFKKGQYAQGILSALEIIEARIEKKEMPLDESSEEERSLPTPVWILFFILLIFALSLRRFFFPFGGYGGGGYHGGLGHNRFGGGFGRGGGGGYSGGGGGFGGGGASDSW